MFFMILIQNSQTPLSRNILITEFIFLLNEFNFILQRKAVITLGNLHKLTANGIFI